MVNLEPEAPPTPTPAPTPPDESGEVTVTRRPTDGTMDAEEFDRQWRQSLGRGTPPDTTMVVEGRPLMAAAGPVRASTVFLPTSQAEGSGHPEAAARWLDAALAEHASVASFARAVMELSAVGAPTALLADHLQAGLDEVKHTEMAFEVARRLGARPQVPGPMPVPAPREPTLARLAGDTFIEGCVNETIAALVASRAATHCADPTTRATLETIAQDEAAHAALAWRTVRWALDRDRRSVSARLASIALPNPGPGRRQAGLLEHGVLDEHHLHRATEEAVARIIVPLYDELLG